jgi:hypothetical protein
MDRPAEYRPGFARPPASGRHLVAGVLLLFLLIAFSAGEAGSEVQVGAPPATLFETGLYVDAEALAVDPDHLYFSPQYPLWTDGATKRRWISLPPATQIDASDPDAWTFPVGTRFWKEFSFAGHRVETRYMERLQSGEWLYAAYEWSADGREAVLAPAKGRRHAYDFGEGRSHTIPGVTDCAVCHEGGPAQVLGFSALQLSPRRDPNALHAERDGAELDLDDLLGKGLLIGYENQKLAAPMVDAASATERAVLGYLHGNCGHCHNSRASLANLGLFLKEELLPQRSAVTSMVELPVRKRAPGQSADANLRIEPGHPERSAIVERLSSRNPALQMPPLGTALVDAEAVALVRKWIIELGADQGPATREEER